MKYYIDNVTRTYPGEGCCPKCGKPYFSIQVGDFPPDMGNFCNCHHKSTYIFQSGCPIIVNPNNEGWICPVCKRVLNPLVKVCDHGQEFINKGWL